MIILSWNFVLSMIFCPLSGQYNVMLWTIYHKFVSDLQQVGGHDITEKLSKVALNTTDLNLNQTTLY
jgi:hypothetical protein